MTNEELDRIDLALRALAADHWASPGAKAAVQRYNGEVAQARIRLADARALLAVRGGLPEALEIELAASAVMLADERTRIAQRFRAIRDPGRAARAGTSVAVAGAARHPQDGATGDRGVAAAAPLSAPAEPPDGPARPAPSEPPEALPDRRAAAAR